MSHTVVGAPTARLGVLGPDRLPGMPVAAAIFASQPASALADVGGVPAARHLARLARDAGIQTVVVVSFDPDGAVAAVIEDLATLVEPAPAEQGPVAQLAKGIDAAVAADPATTGVLLWPARVTDATVETLRALVAAHDADPTRIDRPGADDGTGFPALFPVQHRHALDGIATDLMPGDVLLEVADRGVPMHFVGSPDGG